MGEIFGLKFLLSYGQKPHRILLKYVPPCAKKVIFVNKSVTLDKNLLFYEVKKMVLHMEIFQKINFGPLFIIIFKPEVQKLHPYSILYIKIEQCT